MNLDSLKADLEEGDITYTGNCHNCGTNVTITAKVLKDDSIVIEGGAVYKIKVGLEKRLYFKCDTCFAKDKTLRNFRQCEVYSRIVGYLRPVQQWNKGKVAEWDVRKEFINIKGL